MNDYTKWIIRKELVRQIVEEIRTHADSYSKDISAENLKQNLFSGGYLDRDIEKILEKFGI